MKLQFILQSFYFVFLTIGSHFEGLLNSKNSPKIQDASWFINLHEICLYLTEIRVRILQTDYNRIYSLLIKINVINISL